ncbi:MAG: 2-C-methyl-D-erythritol 4-phosphate cytidylyltransferase [Prevotellaceae bacterium]|jgi:2-C-methyl-D-erythritol 4-phosphate cytidylyltransferase|nr:2-C-methyl-D-erythritol 4-phosphate cytidylyltransferase [Prevotellaceae bacterium]
MSEVETPSAANRSPINTSRSVIIVAGGVGQRMGASIPKQFLPLAGRPLLMHTITQFVRYDATLFIVVALPAAHIDRWQRLCDEYRFATPHRIVAGGDSRAASVRNALSRLPDTDFIAVHDGVRPLTPVDVIARCFATAARYGSAVPVVPVTDSLRKQTADDSYDIPRDGIVTVQTPQVFRADRLRDAYARTADNTAAFTDDASVVQTAGYDITLTEGSRENIKITTPADLPVADALLYLRNR